MILLFFVVLGVSILSAAALLGYTFNPNRDTLIEQITSMGLLEQCEPWVQELFSLLEKEFRPHDLVQSVVKHLNFMKSENRFSEYCYGIEELLIIRLCQQLSKVSVRLSMHIQCFPFMPLLFVALSLCCFENMFDDRPGATTTTANKKNSKEDKLLELSEF
jgi:hypothetical protein